MLAILVLGDRQAGRSLSSMGSQPNLTEELPENQRPGVPKHGGQLLRNDIQVGPELLNLSGQKKFMGGGANCRAVSQEQRGVA